MRQLEQQELGLEQLELEPGLLELKLGLIETETVEFWEFHHLPLQIAVEQEIEKENGR